MRKVSLIVATLMLSACGLTLDESAKAIVDNYCSADEFGRALIRERFNQSINPHQFKVNCEGDVLSD